MYAQKFISLERLKMHRDGRCTEMTETPQKTPDSKLQRRPAETDAADSAPIR